MPNRLSGLHIDLKTEGTTFYTGQAVKGNLILTADKSFKIHDVSLSMYGTEKTNTVAISSKFNNFLNRAYSPSPPGHNLYKSLYRFLIWDAPPSELFSSIGAKQLDLYTLEIPAGTEQFPFEFILPEGIPESYKGKSVLITYRIEAKVDIPNSLGLRKKQEITIVTPSKNNGNNNNEGSSAGHSAVNVQGPSSIGIPIDSAGKTSVSQGDHGTMRYRKKTSTIRLELYKKIFSRGEKIRGKVVLMNITQPEKIREVKITLIGMEYATVDTESPANRALIYAYTSGKMDLKQENKMEEYTKEIEIPKGQAADIIIVPLEFQIPKQVKRSYKGKYSKFYWLIDAKIDMKGMKDPHAHEEITII